MDSSERLRQAGGAHPRIQLPPTEHRLEDLHDAARQYIAAPVARPRRRRTGTFLPALAAALLVGAAITFVGSFVYTGSAEIALVGALGPEKLDVYRRSLIADAIDCFPNAPDQDTPAGWNVATKGENLLVLTTSAASRGDADRVEACAEGFVRHMQEEADRARNTPGETERIMSEYAERLQSRWKSAEADLERAIANLPGADPRGKRDQMLARWRQMRDSFDDVRGRLASAKEVIDTLSAAPPPSEGVVDPQEREDALRADVAVSQDLEELKVRLAELKQAALGAWQESSPFLDQALQQSEKWDLEQPGGEDESRLRTTRFTSEVRRYHEDLAAFATTWNAAFKKLQNAEPDPRSEDILQLHQEARRLLGDFLFQASERFSSMRVHVQTMSEGIEQGARHHVTHSEVVRRFTTLQDAHHRFEFAAGMVEPSDNFRLDSALRSARGLRRRSQDAIAEIDTRLAATAREQARADRLRRITEAEETLKATRTLADRSIEDIVALQEELNLSTDLTESFLRAMVRRDAAGSLAEIALQEFTTTEELVLALKARRLAAIDETRLELSAVHVPEYPANLGAHLRNGLIGFVGTLALIALAAAHFQRAATR